MWITLHVNKFTLYWILAYLILYQNAQQCISWTERCHSNYTWRFRTHVPLGRISFSVTKVRRTIYEIWISYSTKVRLQFSYYKHVWKTTKHGMYRGSNYGLEVSEAYAISIRENTYITHQESVTVPKQPYVETHFAPQIICVLIIPT